MIYGAFLEQRDVLNRRDLFQNDKLKTHFGRRDNVLKKQWVFSEYQ
jgi:hypothetical protein